MLDVDKELKSFDVQSLYTNEALRSYGRQYGVAFLRIDILRDVKKHHIKRKLDKINLLNSALIFTYEQENNGLYLSLIYGFSHHEGILSSAWYTKNTDAGLAMNFHALAPRKYEKQCCRGSSIELIEHAAPGADPPSFYEPIMTKI